MKLITALLLLLIAAPARAEVPVSLLVLIEKTRNTVPDVPPAPPGPVKTEIHQACEGLGCNDCGGDGRIEVAGLPFINAALTKARIPWTTPYGTIGKGRPVWIRFTAADCKPCKTAAGYLDQLVAEGRLRNTIATFVCIKDLSPSYRTPSAIAQHYGITEFPTDIFIDSENVHIYRRTGPPSSPDDYVYRLQDGMASVKGVAEQASKPRSAPEWEWKWQKVGEVCGANGCKDKFDWVKVRAKNRRVTKSISYSAVDDPHADLPAWMRDRIVPPYPSRPIGPRWTMNGGPITREHLASPFDHHADEHFSREWLNTLGFDQVQALGSDSHNDDDERREQYIVRNQ